MSSAELEIRCPCCKERIRLDRLTGQIIAHGSGDKPEDLGAEAAKVERKLDSKEQRADDAFGAALQAEKERAQELEDMFSSASDKVGESSDDSAPDNPLDDRWR